MAYTGSYTSGNNDTINPGSDPGSLGKPRVLGARKLFEKKQPGSPGKLGKASTKSESLSKLRGKGALA